MTEQIFTNCNNGGPVFVYVKDGRIIRMRPIVFKDTDGPTWKIDVNGRIFTSPPKVTVAPYALTEKTRVYSEDRIKYPLKRIDFDPKGERHPENRGKSGYIRISWNEALDIVADEMKRIRSKYGPEAVVCAVPSHHTWGYIGYYFSVALRLFSLLGYRASVASPVSWEGWVWGAEHVWGYYWKLGNPEHNDLLEDGLKNAELIVHWAHDAEATNGVYCGQESSLWRLWLKELGKKQIFIDPFCNYTAAIMADNWIPIRPGTDAALAMAIAYVWIEEGTYDKKYIAEKTLGFKEFEKLILGETDGTPRTPEWAESITGVKARVIRALARLWASKRTMLAAGVMGGMGGICRQAYGHEWCRLMVLLMAMQGMGKPGVNLWSTCVGAPIDMSFDFPGYTRGGINLISKTKFGHSPLPKNPIPNQVYRSHIPDAILNPPISWRGEGLRGGSIEEQFNLHVCPEPGSAEIKMIYRHGGSFMGTGVDTNKWPRAYQSPKLEFVVNQNIFMDPETKFADIILPACSGFERNDISEWGNPDGFHRFGGQSGVNHRLIVYHQKCIEPLYESRSDYVIYSDLAERMGIKEQYTEGNTEEDWIKKYVESTLLTKYISFEEFKKRGYFVVPFPDDYKPAPALRWFQEGRACDNDDVNPKAKTEKNKELGTYSGKIEFVSQSLLKHEPEDLERPLIPRYIPSWEGHESELFKKYPLHLITPHVRYSFHTQHDTHSLWLGDIPGHRICKNGYYYRTTRISPVDAEARGIRQGDIIKVFNDRGAVLGIATVTDRMMPGTIHCYAASSNYDPLEPGVAGSIDRGGCMNILTPNRMMSKNASGMAWNTCLVEVAKWEDQ